MTACSQYEIGFLERVEDRMDSVASPMSISTEIIRDVDQFRDLRWEWNDLLQTCPCDCLFLTWEWVHNWWVHLSGKRKLHIIIVRCDGRLIALAPLVLRPRSFKRFMPWRALEFLASGSVGSDYLSFLIRPGYEDISMQEITASLVQSDHMLELVRIEKASPSMAELAGKLQQSGWDSNVLQTNISPYCSLSGHTWDSYRDSLHSSHRTKLDRMLRRLQKDFDVKLHQVVTEPEREWAMDVMIRLHLERWSDKGGSTALHSQELIDFHQTFSSISLSEGWLRLYTLMLDGVPAASLYVFKYGNVFYHYQSALNLDYSKYSVGSVILALVIKQAIEDGAAEFDFLHDNEAYKYFWARQERELVRLELYPRRKIVNVYRLAQLSKSWIKLLAEKAPSHEHKTHDRTS